MRLSIDRNSARCEASRRSASDGSTLWRGVRCISTFHVTVARAPLPAADARRADFSLDAAAAWTGRCQGGMIKIHHPERRTMRLHRRFTISLVLVAAAALSAPRAL